MSYNEKSDQNLARRKFIALLSSAKTIAVLIASNSLAAFLTIGFCTKEAREYRESLNNKSFSFVDTVKFVRDAPFFCLACLFVVVSVQRS